MDGVHSRSGSCDGTVRIWKISTGECTAVLEAHDDYVISVQFDDQIIASASFDKTVKVYHIALAKAAQFPLTGLESTVGVIPELLAHIS
jgi:WD40 repeat protein